MKRNAFTLVELLVVLLVLSLLTGMTAVTVSGVTGTARAERTRGIVSVLNDVLLTKYESYKTRPLPVAVPTAVGSEVKLEIPPREAARVRLIMIRDLMRMEMPDRKVDVTDNPISISCAVHPVIYDSATNQYRRQAAAVKTGVSWFTGGNNVPAQLAAYRDRIPPNDLASDPPFSKWTREWESAEALYLIVSTTFLQGMPAIESIPPTNIGDTDGDGMLEILDAWERPIGFIRWPVDYVDNLGIPVTDD
ncbi:MAG: prepilin-type N-terminal cleavage/methylation domain-containing protein, partial [Pirellulaceae bacterium]|nr:prepilin-type N-terminal cleavage/methylation domain-containing protein [Pirellulaceae bacterium]